MTRGSASHEDANRIAAHIMGGVVVYLKLNLFKCRNAYYQAYA